MVFPIFFLYLDRTFITDQFKCRYMYTKLNKGQNSQLTEERKSLLESLGFEWTTRDQGHGEKNNDNSIMGGISSTFEDDS